MSSKAYGTQVRFRACGKDFATQSEATLHARLQVLTSGFQCSVFVVFLSADLAKDTREPLLVATFGRSWEV